MAYIHVDKLCKNYRIKEKKHIHNNGLTSIFARKNIVKEAVKDVTFNIEKGEMVGYIGMNGAGKSTTIKMLTGILVPSSGTIEVNGLVPWEKRKQYVKNIGVVFGQRTQLWWDLPVADTFSLMKEMYAIPKKIFNQRMEMFFDVLNINEFVKMPVRQLSLGQRMRSDLCCAMLHNPSVLFLDEPTIGLDILAKEKIRNFISLINKENNTTVLLTTHDMKDIEHLCSRIIIIDKGSIKYDGNIIDFKGAYESGHLVKVTFGKPYKKSELENMEGLSLVNYEENIAIFQYSSNHDLRTVYHYLLNKFDVYDILNIENELEVVLKSFFEKM